MDRSCRRRGERSTPATSPLCFHMLRRPPRPARPFVCRELADRYFFETVVHLHRAGEGAPFTGLKPAGLDVGPIIPIAEKAIESEDVAALGRGARGCCARAGGRALPSSRPPSRRRPPWRGRRAVVRAGHARAASLDAWALPSHTRDRSRARPHARVRRLSFFLFSPVSGCQGPNAHGDIHVPGRQTSCEASVLRGRDRRGQVNRTER